MSSVEVSDDTLGFVQRCQCCARYWGAPSSSTALFGVVGCFQTVPVPQNPKDVVVISTCIMKVAAKADAEFRDALNKSAKVDHESRRTVELLRCLLQQSSDCTLTLERIARSRGVSSTRLCRAFVADVGMGFSKCLGAVRLVQACCLMSYGQLTLKEIAFHAGFASKSDFSRAFRRWFRMCPSTFRDRFGAFEGGMSRARRVEPAVPAVHRDHGSRTK
jgi:AraC-like DNA-binding protein